MAFSKAKGEESPSLVVVGVVSGSSCVEQGTPPFPSATLTSPDKSGRMCLATDPSTSQASDRLLPSPMN